MGDAADDVEVAVKEVVGGEGRRVYPFDLFEGAFDGFALEVLDCHEDDDERRAAVGGVFVAGDLPANGGFDAKFFAEFAAKGFAGRLACLDLTAGEFPFKAVAVACPPLANKKPAVSADDAGGDNDGAGRFARIDQELPLYSDRLIRHFQQARLAGELPAPAASVTMENPACGDILKLSARVEAGRVAEVRFLVKGCTASIACGSAVAEWLERSVVKELKSRKASEVASLVEAEVGGLPQASKHAARLAAECAVKLISCLEA